MRFSFSSKYLSRKINGTFLYKILNRNDSMLKVNMLKAYNGCSKLHFSTTSNHKEIKQMVCNASQRINFHKIRLVTETNFHTHHCEVNKGKWWELLILTIAYKTSYSFLTKKSNIRRLHTKLNYIHQVEIFLNDNFKLGEIVIAYW